MQGGGGSRSTGKSCTLDPNVILNLIQDLSSVVFYQYRWTDSEINSE